MFRSLARALGMAAGWAELVPLTLLLWLLSFTPFPRPAYRSLFRYWSRVWVAALGVRLRLHQHNLHPLPPVFLLIANHPSAFEDVGIPALFDVDSLAKHEVRHWFLVGRISAAAGTLYVERDSQESRRHAAKAIARHLRGGRSMALYPEGGVKGMRVHEFRYGAFAVSLETGIPIVPVFIHYEAQRDFFWDRESLPLKLWQIMRATNPVANYHLFDAIDPRDFTDKADYCQAVQQRYLDWQARYLE
ncbi:lysophospholipid acyltransferase family protein [endosymbiont of unidentified scaly snail isolate Monju]|uniref:lysophospholipid acyltransferase family protein n=1 Tax=endosymbiont of unidentified scaly snail isolate Monju TaxID=1248727 RepID=UPI0003892223|nr:lysophospholipid acyltransferase family protein [endosymbiont of unidentified scaly snail isolate Monju]BAN68578.1 1-acyl-sn-glycerol-3-phosphate acyltransferase [endosymbiont of unidentified scaly snail isolate Monju]